MFQARHGVCLRVALPFARIQAPMSGGGVSFAGFAPNSFSVTLCVLCGPIEIFVHHREHREHRGHRGHRVSPSAVYGRKPCDALRPLRLNPIFPHRGEHSGR